MKNNNFTVYLELCKKFYQSGNTPLSGNIKTRNEYEKFTQISQALLSEDFEAFSGLLQEGMYYVNLWTAHFIVEYKPDSKIKEKAIEIIKRYAFKGLNNRIREEEAEWLKSNGY